MPLLDEADMFMLKKFWPAVFKGAYALWKEFGASEREQNIAQRAERHIKTATKDLKKDLEEAEKRAGKPPEEKK